MDKMTLSPESEPIKGMVSGQNFPVETEVKPELVKGPPVSSVFAICVTEEYQERASFKCP